jgi:spore germination protein GerM
MSKGVKVLGNLKKNLKVKSKVNRIVMERRIGHRQLFKNQKKNNQSRKKTVFSSLKKKLKVQVMNGQKQPSKNQPSPSKS